MPLTAVHCVSMLQVEDPSLSAALPDPAALASAAAAFHKIDKNNDGVLPGLTLTMPTSSQCVHSALKATDSCCALRACTGTSVVHAFDPGGSSSVWFRGGLVQWLQAVPVVGFSYLCHQVTYTQYYHLFSTLTSTSHSSP